MYQRDYLIYTQKTESEHETVNEITAVTQLGLWRGQFQVSSLCFSVVFFSVPVSDCSNILNNVRIH